METIDEEVTKEAIRFMGEAKKADKTTVMYSTDNGAEKLSWPDGGTSPFRGEKNTNWEDGFRHSLARRRQARQGSQRHLRRFRQAAGGC